MIIPSSGNSNGNSLLLREMKLTNFRCFSELKIDFDDRLTVLVANNGQGKTAALDAIAIALGPFVGAFDEGRDRPFQKDDIRLVYSQDSNATMEQAAGGITLEAFGYVAKENAWPGGEDPNWTHWKRQLSGPKARTTRKDAQRLSEYGKNLQDAVRRGAELGAHTGVVLPLVAYYDTARLWKIRRQPNKKLSRTSRMVGYTHCLESGSDYHLFADWFRFWSTNAWTQRIKEQQAGLTPRRTEFDDAIEAVRQAVNDCLQLTEWGRIDFSAAHQEMVAFHPQQGELPVAMLSDGIRSMLGLVADIAFRAVKLNPNLGPFAAKSTPGIVLIDEIEMHLHPAWQQTVLASLREAFPRMQFIVTTHSPQVLTTVPAQCIRVLRREWDEDIKKYVSTVERVAEQTLGVESSDALAVVMGVDPRPDVHETRQLSEYMALIEQGLHNTDAGIEMRRSLQSHFGQTHPLMLECDRLIRLQQFKHKLSSKE